MISETFENENEVGALCECSACLNLLPILDGEVPDICPNCDEIDTLEIISKERLGK